MFTRNVTSQLLALGKSTAKAAKGLATKPKESESDDFSTQLRSALKQISKDNVISEEELFAAITQVRVRQSLGDTGNTYFEGAREIYESDQASKKRYSPQEIITKNSLAYLVEIGQMSNPDRRAFQQECAAMAQMDDKRALYDQYGGANDSTSAKMSIAKAVEMAAQRFATLQASKV